MDARVRKQLESVACDTRVCLIVRDPAGGGAGRGGVGGVGGVAGTPAVFGDPDTPAESGDPAMAGVIIAPMIRPGSFRQRSRQHASNSWQRYLNRRGVQTVEELNLLASDGYSRERVETDEDSPYFGALMRGRRPVVDGVRLAGLWSLDTKGAAADVERLAERLNMPMTDQGRSEALRAIVPFASGALKSVVVLVRGGLDLQRLGETLQKAGGALKPTAAGVAAARAGEAELGLDELSKLVERAGG